MFRLYLNEKNINMAFKLRNQGFSGKGRFNLNDEAAPGTPLLRKELGKGITAEANNDGTMFVSIDVEPGSYEEQQAIIHEMVHMTDMKTGKLSYNDEMITWNGENFPRKNGKVLFENRWLKEGSKEFPWEQMPWE